MIVGWWAKRGRSLCFEVTQALPLTRCRMALLCGALLRSNYFTIIPSTNHRPRARGVGVATRLPYMEWRLSTGKGEQRANHCCAKLNASCIPTPRNASGVSQWNPIGVIKDWLGGEVEGKRRWRRRGAGYQEPPSCGEAISQREKSNVKLLYWRLPRWQSGALPRLTSDWIAANSSEKHSDNIRKEHKYQLSMLLCSEASWCPGLILELKDLESKSVERWTVQIWYLSPYKSNLGLYRTCCHGFFHSTYRRLAYRLMVVHPSKVRRSIDNFDDFR